MTASTAPDSQAAHLLGLLCVLFLLALTQCVLAHVFRQHVNTLLHQLQVLLQTLVKRLEITILYTASLQCQTP